MSERIDVENGWIVFYEKQDKDGKWLDHVEPNFQTHAEQGLMSHRGVQQTIEAFDTKEQARESGLRKAKAWLDAVKVFLPVTGEPGS